MDNPTQSKQLEESHRETSSSDPTRPLAPDSEQPVRPITAVSWYNLGFACDLVFLIAAFIIALVMSNLHPFERPVDLKDTDLMHPHMSNIVPNYLLIILAVLIPAAVGSLWYLMIFLTGRVSLHDSLYSFHLFLVSLFLSISLTMAATNLMKNWAGRLRPDFLDRCQYNMTTSVCTGDPSLVEDGRKSFPSGHASISFSGLGFLALWIYGLVLAGIIVRPQNGQREENGQRYIPNRPVRAWRFIMPAIPLLLAAWVAITRTQQYIHHPTDVIAGSILGLVVAFLFYFLYYRKHRIQSFSVYARVPSSNA